MSYPERVRNVVKMGAFRHWLASVVAAGSAMALSASQAANGDCFQPQNAANARRTVTPTT
jgi:hypothetical protein